MKNIFFFFIFLIPTITVCQSKMDYDPIPDARLFQAYDSSYINTLLIENPFLIERWNYYLDHSWQLTDFFEEKDVTYPLVTVPDHENINIFLLEKKLGLNRNFDRPSAYRIQNTDKVFIYLSGKQFNKRFKAYLQKKMSN